jgi:hypothetical protein
MNKARENYPHEAELFDKYPRLYEKAVNLMDLLHLVLKITLWGWAITAVALLITLLNLR